MMMTSRLFRLRGRRTALLLSLSLICGWSVADIDQVSAETPVVIELGQLQVSETKPNGKRWDFGLGSISKPDLMLKMYLDREELVVTKICKDAFTCLFQRSIPILVRGTQDLSITVVDRDLKRDDVIDQLTVKLTESELGESKEIKLAGKSTTLLTFTVRPLAAKPSAQPKPATKPIP